MARPKLLQSQVIAINRIMEAHCKSADGMAIYEAGWGDERVTTEAEAVNPAKDKPISLGAVQAMRRNLFGRVINKSNNANSAAVETLEARVAALEGEVEEIAAWGRAIIERTHHLYEWARRRGYEPPPGRPQSTPPSPPANN